MKLNKAQEELVNKIIDSLEKEDLIWRKTWQSLHGNKPYNFKSNNSYSGLNLLILSFESLIKEYHDPRWMTFNQAKDLGYKVKKGSKGTTLTYYSLYDPDSKKIINKQDYLLMNLEERQRITTINKCFSVFNASQIEGLELMEVKKKDELTTNFIASNFIDNLKKNLDIKVSHIGDSAFYSPVADRIVIPNIEAFDSEDYYHATLLHELSHATGHQSRLDRNLLETSNDKSYYAKEELVAEISSAFLSMDLEMDIANLEDNNIAYCQSWANQIKEEPRYLLKCINDATKAYEYLKEKGNLEFVKSNYLTNESKKDTKKKLQKSNIKINNFDLEMVR